MKRNGKMYKIEVPETIRILIALYYRLGIWNDQITIREVSLRCFYFIYVVLFLVSTALGAYTTSDRDECIFLVVCSVQFVVQDYRFWLILWRKNEFLSLLQEVSVYDVEEQSEFDEINKMLNAFMKFVQYYLFALFVGAIVITVFPFFNEKKFLLNIYVPFDRTNSSIGFCIAFVFLNGGCFGSLTCTIFTSINWYLMLSFTLQYKLLGRKLERMGTISIGESELNISLAEQQYFYHKDLVKVIQKYDKVNGLLDEFGTHFGTLFFLQVATGSLCICGAVYNLAFSSNADLMVDALNCILLLYSIFDVFMVMYLGNEIVLASDELSRCLYNSNWYEQTQSCKRCILIFGERLRQPKQLVVGILYPLNLLTFTSIINSAYSMFNILQNLRE